MSNPFSGVSAAQLSESGSYFPYAKARYLCEVSRVLMKNSRKSGELFTVELKVLESTHPEVFEGETRTWQVKMSNVDTAPGNLKMFALAMMGVPTNDQKKVAAVLSKIEKALQEACDDGKYNGAIVAIDCEPIRTKAGNDFTKCTFSPGALKA